MNRDWETARSRWSAGGRGGLGVVGFSLGDEVGAFCLAEQEHARDDWKANKLRHHFGDTELREYRETTDLRGRIERCVEGDGDG